jgi:hypothetical protein
MGVLTTLVLFLADCVNNYGVYNLSASYLQPKWSNE